MSKSKRTPAAIACTCTACRHLGAKTWRKIHRPRLAESYPDAARLDAELTSRWHEYEPRMRELASDLPGRVTNQCFDGVTETPAVRGLLEWEASNMDQDLTIAVLAGPHGTGKTMATVYVALFAFAAEPPIFVTAHKLARDLRDKETRRDALRRCLEASVLIIDDLGKEQPSSFFARDVDELVDHFYQGFGWLVITTNLKPSEFRERYGEGAADRMRERAKWIACGGKSMRGPKKPTT